MKNYNSYEDLREDLKELMKQNPLRESILINGEEVKVFCNFIYTVEFEDGEVKTGGASGAFSITPTELRSHANIHIGKVFDYYLEHVKTIE